MRRVTAGNKKDLIKAKTLLRRVGHCQMSGMDGVERAPEKSDTPAAL